MKGKSKLNMIEEKQNYILNLNSHKTISTNNEKKPFNIDSELNKLNLEIIKKSDNNGIHKSKRNFFEVEKSNLEKIPDNHKSHNPKKFDLEIVRHEVETMHPRIIGSSKNNFRRWKTC